MTCTNINKTTFCYNGKHVNSLWTMYGLIENSLQIKHKALLVCWDLQQLPTIYPNVPLIFYVFSFDCKDFLRFGFCRQFFHFFITKVSSTIRCLFRVLYKWQKWKGLTKWRREKCQKRCIYYIVKQVDEISGLFTETIELLEFVSVNKSYMKLIWQ